MKCWTALAVTKHSPVRIRLLIRTNARWANSFACPAQLVFVSNNCATARGTVPMAPTKLTAPNHPALNNQLKLFKIKPAVKKKQLFQNSLTLFYNNIRIQFQSIIARNNRLTKPLITSVQLSMLFIK